MTTRRGEDFFNWHQTALSHGMYRCKCKCTELGWQGNALCGSRI